MLKIATHFLNKYLSPYVKNIDESKLKVQLTAGSVALENLELVENVLDEFDIPLQVISGHLNRLTLKVPWHKIYSAPTIVTVDGLYIVLVPKSELSYDVKKEEEQLQNEKIKQVKLFEQRAQERSDSPDEDPKDPKSMGTFEKLGMTVVKNLQIRINNIHVRYEDGYSCPGTTLAAGVMLDSLTFDSANENFKPMLVEELSQRFFKLVQLKNFSFYLDVPITPSDCYAPFVAVSTHQLCEKLHSDISAMSQGSRGSLSHSFIIAPFSATARLKLNTRPELTDFSESRAFLELDLQTFSLGISQKQYRTLIELVDAMDFIKLRYRYRKYRPQVPCKGNAKKWWQYAINCVRDDHRGLYSSVNEMVKFIRCAKLYRQLYYTKLTKKHISEDIVLQLTKCEQKLDAFNIVLQRRQAELEAKRAGLLQSSSSNSSGSWFSSMFGWKREASPPLASTESSANKSFAKQLDEALTAEDKAQIIQSIGLDDEGFNTKNFPPGYVAYRVDVSFRSLEINCYDSSANLRKTVAQFALTTIRTNLALRANNSLKVAGHFRRLHLTGVDGVSFAEAPPPESLGSSSTIELLKFEFDSKTIDSGDQSLIVESQPLAITYHAATVNCLREFFTLPPSAKLQAVSEIAANAAQDLKEKSVEFVKSVLENRPFVDIRVQLRGGYVVLPETGDISKAKSLMIADLGMLSVHAEPKRSSSQIDVNVDQLDANMPSKQQQAALLELKKSAYNRFKISVEPVQVLLCSVEDDWRSLRINPNPDSFLLPPLHIWALFGMCIISDPRLPATSLDFALHPAEIEIKVCDTRLRSAVLLLASIPFMPSHPETPAKEDEQEQEQEVDTLLKRRSSTTDGRGLGTVNQRQAVNQLSNSTQSKQSGKPSNAKLFALSFSLNRLTCQLTDSKSNAILHCVVDRLTFSMNADIYTVSGGMTLHAFHFQHQRISTSPVNRKIHNLINTAVSPMPSSSSYPASIAAGLAVQSERSNLLTVRFLYADPLGPEFDKTHQRRKVQLFVRVGSVELLLHREAILDVIQMATTFAEAAAVASPKKPQTAGPPPSSVRKKSGSITSLHNSFISLAEDVGGRFKDIGSKGAERLQLHPNASLHKIRRRPEIIHLYIDAKLDRISGVLKTEQAVLGFLQVGGLATKISTKLLSTTIESSLLELSVFSARAPASDDHKYQMVLSAAHSEGPPAASAGAAEIATVKIVAYNEDHSAFVDVEAADVLIEARLAQLRFLLAQRFVENIIDYALGFGHNVVDRVRDASADLANSAKAGIQQIHEDAKKIRFDLALSSPVVIIPKTPDEKHAFFAVHLGQFMLENVFDFRSQDDHEAAISAARSQLADPEEEDTEAICDIGEAALLNCIQIELTGVKFVRGWSTNLETVVEDGLDPRFELPMIGPISLNIAMDQNLSAGIRHLVPTAVKFPDIKIAVQMDSIDLCACQGDYFMLLKVVEWLMETKFGQPNPEKPAWKAIERASKTPDQEEKFDKSFLHSSFGGGPSSHLMANRDVLAIKCKLGKVSCRLYSGDVEFPNGPDPTLQVTYNSANLLAMLSILDVEATFSTKGNANKSASVTMLNLTIDDARPSRTKKERRVTRLMECFNQLSVMKINPLVPQTPPRLIVVAFEECPEKRDRSLKLELNNLHACINAEFLVMLANFFSSKTAAVHPKVNLAPVLSHTAGADLSQQLADREATADIETPYTFKIHVKLAGPKVLLLDDPSVAHPAALALQFDFNTELIMLGDEMAGAASLCDLAMYWGSYDSLKTGDTDMAQRLLKPMSVDVALNDSKTDSGPVSHVRKINVSCPEVTISVTPPAIRTISIVSRELSALGSPVSDSKTVSSSPQDVKKGMWNPEHIKKLDLDFLYRSDSVSEALNLIEESETMPLSSSPASLTVVLASFPMMTVKLSTGSKREIVPLIKLRSTGNLRASAYSTGEMKSELQFDLEVAYYNDQLYIWEPLLEPVECTVAGAPPLFTPPAEVLRHRRALFNIEMTKRVPVDDTTTSRSGDGAEEDAVVTPSVDTSITVQTNDMLQFVVTKIGLSVLNSVAQSFSRAYRADEVYSFHSSDVKMMYPVILYNHTDTKFTIRPDSRLTCAKTTGADQQSSSASLSAHHIILNPNSFAALDFASSVSRARSMSHNQPSTSDVVNKAKNTAKLLTYEAQRSYKFTIYADDYRSTKELVVDKADSVLFRVLPLGGDATATPHSFVCRVTASEGNIVVEFTSFVKITNHLPEPIDLLCNYAQTHSAYLHNVLSLQSGRSGYLPLKTIYSSSGGIFVKPVNENFDTSENTVAITNSKQKQTIVKCPPMKDDEPPLIVSAFMEVTKVEAEKQYANGFAVNKEDVFHLHIKPLVTVKNLLPFTVTVSDSHESNVFASQNYTIEPGRQQPLRHCTIPDSTMAVQLLSYCGYDWSATFKVGTVCVTKNTFITFTSSSEEKQLDLAFFMFVEHGAIVLSIYSPYWFVNRTGMKLTYKVLEPDTIFHHDEAGDAPLLVSAAGKSAAKRKIQLKVGDSDWSDKFNVDTVGSAGTVVCKFRNSFTYNGNMPSSKNKNQNRDRTRRSSYYCCCSRNDDLLQTLERMVGLKIVLGSCKLTKIITMTPYFFLINKCHFDIQCQETLANSKSYSLFKAPPDQCIPFWPMEVDVVKQRMTVTIKETGETSLPFPYALQDSMVLKFGPPVFAINVACYVCDGAIHITFEPYVVGDAPVQIVNHTQRMQLEYSQEKDHRHDLLDAMQAVLYAWPDPALEKTLQWAPYDISRRISVRPTLISRAVSAVKSPSAASRPTSTSSHSYGDLPPATKYYSTDVSKDCRGSFQADPDTKIYWVSFMHKKQRTLLFTEDQSLFKTISSEQGELEERSLDIFLKIAAVGLSLVDNKRKQELAYAAIAPSAVEWQFKRKQGYKAFSSRETSLLESARDVYELKKAVDPGNVAQSSRVVMDNGKFEVDLAGMYLFRGNEAIKIRRICQDGIYLNCGFSEFHSHIHFKLNRIQIDNQLPEARFQTVLAPVPPPKSVAVDACTPKPFIELSLLLRKQTDAQMLQFKYCKALVQEMSLQVDLPFILQIASFFVMTHTSIEEEYELFKQDVERTELSLEKTDLGPELSGGQKHFFELLHISPLKVHLSFSPQTSGGSSSNDHAVSIGDVGAFFLSSIGIMTGDVQDAVFRLGYYQQNSILLSIPQLMNNMQSHYTQQALRQFFNILLGFDVLGNPVGVLRGFASGVETLFYEPWQGAIQGPEELAKGVAIGLQQFFGKTVGGVTGALSKVTGTVGHGMAKLTFDEDYQRARKSERRQTKNVGQSLAYGGQQLVFGLFDGVTGIVRKPVEGAQKEGVEGFFKGLGVGLVGVVTRPTAGVVDFASTGLDTIRRVTDAVEEVKRIRPPRLILPDSIIRPYLFAEAEANSILIRCEKGRYKNDVFAGHLLLSKDNKRLLVITERGLLGLTRLEMLNQWDVDYVYTWSELRDLPTLGRDGIVVPLKERQKRLGFLTGQQMSRVIHFACDARLAEEFVTRMQETKNRVS